MCLFVLITLVGCGKQQHHFVSYCYYCMSPESVTTLVRAECTGETTSYNRVEYIKFKTVENLYGETGDFFWLVRYSTDSPYAHHIYEESKEYLIFAEKEVSVYMPFDKFSSPNPDAFFPIDALGYQVSLLVDRYIPLDIGIPIIYNNFDATNPENIEEATNEEVYQRFTKLVVDYLNSDPNRPQFYGRDYTRSDDWDIIAEEADHVVVLKAGKNLDGGRYPFTEEVECTVIENKSGTDISDKIIVTFFEDTVKKGGTYLVCLNDYAENCYELSAKNAVKTVKEPLPTAVIIIVSSAAVGLLLITSVTLVFLKVGRARRRIENTDSDK